MQMCHIGCEAESAVESKLTGIEEMACEMGRNHVPVE